MYMIQDGMEALIYEAQDTLRKMREAKLRIEVDKELKAFFERFYTKDCGEFGASCPTTFKWSEQGVDENNSALRNKVIQTLRDLGYSTKMSCSSNYCNECLYITPDYERMARVRMFAL